MLKFTVDYGMLQVKDINPAAAGLNTKDLTNPGLEDEEEVKQEIITGQGKTKTNPLRYVIAAAVVLFLISYFQKK